MKFVHFFFIFGILLKGQYTSGTTLSSDFYTNRKLLASGGAAQDPALEYIFLSEKCILTGVSTDKAVGGTDCVAEAAYCDKPEGAGACPDDSPKLPKETVESGLHVFAITSKGPGETTADTADCGVVSFTREDPASQIKVPVTVKVEGEKITIEVTGDADAITKEQDLGAPVLCGGKLFAIVSAMTDKAGEAVSVSKFLGGGSTETTGAAESNTTDAEEAQTAATTEGSGSEPTISPPITVTAFSMLGFVFFGFFAY